MVLITRDDAVHITAANANDRSTAHLCQPSFFFLVLPSFNPYQLNPRLLRAVLLDKVIHRVKQNGIEIMLRSPANQLVGFCHIGDAAVAVLISLAVKLLARYRDYLRVGIAGLTKIFVE